jgi:hypothetical protein
MRVRVKQSLAALAALLLAVPMFAAKSSGANVVNYVVNDPVSIGQTQLKPGEYSLKVVEGQNELSIEQNGKVIAKVPCHWIKLAAKPDSSEVEEEQGKVKQVNFKDNPQAVQVD